jgi:hypothetical protein
MAGRYTDGMTACTYATPRILRTSTGRLVMNRAKRNRLPSSTSTPGGRMRPARTKSLTSTLIYNGLRRPRGSVPSTASPSNNRPQRRPQHRSRPQRRRSRRRAFCAIALHVHTDAPASARHASASSLPAHLLALRAGRGRDRSACVRAYVCVFPQVRRCVACFAATAKPLTRAAPRRARLLRQPKRARQACRSRHPLRDCTCHKPLRFPTPPAATECPECA